MILPNQSFTSRNKNRDDDLCALLFEDLGDTLLADALPALDAEQQRTIYREAGLFAGLIASVGTPRVNQDHPLSHPRLGRERLPWELSLFATPDVGGRRGITDHGLFADLSELLHRIADAAAAGPQELAHRDFHARNLMLLPGARIAVVDYQDTLFAPRYYDLASLVRDPYVEPAEPLVAAAVAGYRETGACSGDPLADPLFSWVALQRDLKALGTYAFQGRWRKNERFFTYSAPAERMAMRALPGLPQDARPMVDYVLKRLGFEPGA